RPWTDRIREFEADRATLREMHDRQPLSREGLPHELRQSGLVPHEEHGLVRARRASDAVEDRGREVSRGELLPSLRSGRRLELPADQLGGPHNARKAAGRPAGLRLALARQRPLVVIGPARRVADLGGAMPDGDDTNVLGSAVLFRHRKVGGPEAGVGVENPSACYSQGVGYTARRRAGVFPSASAFGTDRSRVTWAMSWA